MGWTEVRQSGNLVKWDEPKTIEGAYAGNEERTTEYGENVVHFVNTNDGRVGFFGTTQLNDALKNVPPGKIVQVEYTGKKTKTPKGFLKEFVVRVWEAEPEKAAF